MQNLYVQFGAGWCAGEGWLNFDNSPTLRMERLLLVGKFVRRNARRFPDAVKYGDIIQGLPVSAGSCAGIYASHVLEHLSLEDFRTALRKTHDLLQQRGIFRLVVPDLESLAKNYVESRDSAAAEIFMRHSGLGKSARPRGVKGLLTAWLGNSAHLWMWDEKSLRAELERAGFSLVKRCQFNDCEDAMFQKVEDIGRFEGALAMEAVK